MSYTSHELHIHPAQVHCAKSDIIFPLRGLTYGLATWVASWLMHERNMFLLMHMNLLRSMECTCCDSISLG